jgi:hypothetical protein
MRMVVKGAAPLAELAIIRECLTPELVVFHPAGDHCPERRNGHAADHNEEHDVHGHLA